jgi:putative oxidoreductase
MSTLGLSPLDRMPAAAPLVLRLVFGFMIAAHGWQKLQAGPANFATTLTKLGVPAPDIMAWVVTLTELGGGILLIVGLLTRLAAVALTINLTVALLLVRIDAGLISMQGGFELELGYIAGFLAILLAGPGSASIDRAIGLDSPPVARTA